MKRVESNWERQPGASLSTHVHTGRDWRTTVKRLHSWQVWAESRFPLGDHSLGRNCLVGPSAPAHWTYLCPQMKTKTVSTRCQITVLVQREQKNFWMRMTRLHLARISKKERPLAKKVFLRVKGPRLLVRTGLEKDCGHLPGWREADP